MTRASGSLIALAMLGVTLAACGDASGRRPAAAGPPEIPPGRYATPTDPQRTDQRYWTIDLDRGGRTRQARVSRCDLGCMVHVVPIRAGLNGLAFVFPADSNEPETDVAISVSADGITLAHREGEGLWQAPLRREPASVDSRAAVSPIVIPAQAGIQLMPPPVAPAGDGFPPPRE